MCLVSHSTRCARFNGLQARFAGRQPVQIGLTGTLTVSTKVQSYQVEKGIIGETFNLRENPLRGTTVQESKGRTRSPPVDFRTTCIETAASIAPSCSGGLKYKA